MIMLHEYISVLAKSSGYSGIIEFLAKNFTENKSGFGFKYVISYRYYFKFVKLYVSLCKKYGVKLE